MNILDFTVAIPTFNGAQRLPLVLDRLREQEEVENLRWEIIVIDNNSQDETRSIVEYYQSTHFPCPLKYLFEPKQGAGFARQLAIREARSEIIGFLDDDNLPTPNWVAEAVRFLKDHPHAGAVGSQIHGDFEVPPPENFKRIACFLAINELGQKPILYTPEGKMLPPSAGLVVRRSVWISSVSDRTTLTGPTEHFPLNSEDLEVILQIQNKGWEIWYNANMVIYHKIPGSRLQRNNLLQTIRRTGLARHHIRMLRFPPKLRPFLIIPCLLSDTYQIVRYYLSHRNALGKDIVTDCEMEFLKRTLYSPFYFWFIKK